MLTSSCLPRVLVVDDDPIVLRMLVRVLDHLGAVAIPATGAREAIALLARMKAPPALVLTELELPGAGGAALLRHVRADPALAGTPVVAMSASPTKEPFDLHLEKPFAVWELRAALLRAAGAAVPVSAVPAPAARRDVLARLDARPGPARRVSLSRPLATAPADRRSAAGTPGLARRGAPPPPGRPPR